MPPLRIGFVPGPGLGREQPPVDQGRAALPGVGHEHPRLAVGHLPQATAVLTGHPHRVHPLLGHVRGVHQEDALARAQLGSHRLPVAFQEWLVGPGAVRRKVPRAAHLVHVAVQFTQDHALD